MSEVAEASQEPAARPTKRAEVETLYIQSSPEETRVALQQGDAVVELQLERTTGRGLSGNIYRGKVQRIIPSMDAAFVEIGLSRAALLHASDVWSPAGMADGEADDEGNRAHKSAQPIEELLRAGQHLMVQVVREPVGKKGPRVTTFISLPGRNAVFLARDPHVGVSKMIDDPAERARLEGIVKKHLPAGSGAIVRTVGEGATEQEVADDVSFLARQWADIQTRYEAASGPSFIFDDLDLTLRVLRDMVGTATKTVWIDDPADQDRVQTFVRRFHPESQPEVRLHTSVTPMFPFFGLDRWVKQATEPRVSLPSGGELVIERTEAMTVIDVNSGKQLGAGSLDAAMLALNLEAASAIARELRLRNIGGLVVVDFVDLKRSEDRRALEQGFGEALARDRARIRLGRVSEFGTVQLTRKRTRESIYERLTEPCPACHARGHVRAAADLALETLGRVRAALRATGAHSPVLKIQAPPRVAAILKDQLAEPLAALEKEYSVKLEILETPRLSGDVRVLAGG